MKEHTLIEKLNKADLMPYRPIPFWSWNDKLEPEELRRQIRTMKQAGMGGFFMHARGGLETEYMGKEWFDAIDASVDEAKKLGMGAWCYDENGWPSGFAGGVLLEDKANWAHYLRFEEKTNFDADALAVYVWEGERISRVTGQNAATKYLCVYDCTNSSTVDILNPRITDAFLELTHQRYAEYFGERFAADVQGFFTDEPQYFRWDTAYSPMLLEEYSKRYGRDLLDELGGLFVDCKGAKGFRFRYWRLMNELYCEGFIARVYRWCEDHGCRITGHSIEEKTVAVQNMFTAGVMPFYEYEHIPGIDWLGRKIGTELSPRQVSSVAQQMGRKQVIAETFACVGWDVTPKELMRMVHWQFVNGVNLLCHHLYPYSIRGQRKRDYPAFYSEHNPWTTEQVRFNDYFTKLGYLLAESKEAAPILVLHPMHSTYLTFDRRTYSGANPEFIGDSFDALNEKLSAAGMIHHYADERLLEKYGSVENGKITLGNCAYSYLVIPPCYTLDSSTVRLLREYLAQGGKVYTAGQLPTMMDGEEADLSFLKGNMTFEELAEETALFVNQGSEIRATLRHSPEGSFLFATNISENKKEKISVKLPFAGAVVWNLMDSTTVPAVFWKTDSGIEVTIELEAGEGVVLLDCPAEAQNPAEKREKAIPLTGSMEIAQPVENSLTLDCAEFSYDGANYEGPYSVMAISQHMLKERTNRPLWLRYTFNAQYLPKTLAVEVEHKNVRGVYVNGQEVSLTEKGTLDVSFLRGDISPYLQVGENAVVVKLDYHQTEHIYHVFNGYYFETANGGTGEPGTGQVTETLMNCLSYETNIEAIYLFGEFAVQSRDGYRPAGGNAIRATGDFEITAPVKEVMPQSITTQGFPFFHESMVLRTKVQVEDTDWSLRCTGRLQYAKVRVNCQDAGMLLLQNKLDLSKFLRVGENVLELELMSSNRNLFGPFHCQTAEPMLVFPDLFSCFGTWKNWVSPDYNPEYAFVPFGADIQLER